MFRANGNQKSWPHKGITSAAKASGFFERVALAGVVLLCAGVHVSAGVEQLSTMGLLDEKDWHAKWIGLDGVEQTNWLQDAYPGFVGSSTRLSWIWHTAGGSENSAPPGAYYFRREIVIPFSKPPIKEAHLQFAGDSECRAWINGFDLGAQKGYRSVRDADVTCRVYPGTNIVCLAGINNGANPKSAGVIAYLEFEFIKGDALLFWTDEQWKVSDKVEQGWNQQGFDDSKWKAARTLGVLEAPPWGNIRAPEGRRLPARYLRKDFAVGKKVGRAVVSFAGLGWSELYLNGVKLGDVILSPDIADYAKQVFYLSWDVTKQLQQGTNTLGAILGNGAYYAPRSEVSSGAASFGWPKMILQLRVDYSDATVSEVVSDDSWQISVQGPIRANNIYDGEDYDANYDLTGWNKPGYAGVRDSALRPKSARGPSASPYKPPPGNGLVQSEQFSPQWEPAHIVTAPAGKLVEQRTQPARVAQTVKPVSLFEPNPGVFVFDMGRSLTGWCRLRITGPAEAQVVLRHAETLKTDGTLDCVDLHGAKATDTYTLRGSDAEEIWEPRFTCHRFRYVEVTGYPGRPTLDSVEGRLVTKAPAGL